jgi:xanthine dehydrogenase accessory factor
MNDKEIYKKRAELKDQGIVACLATIIETVGSTPREAGAKMIICADGTLYGSVGGGCGESEVRSAALRSILTSQKSELLEIDLTDDIGTRDGDVCGGKMRIFVEPMVS